LIQALEAAKKDSAGDPEAAHQRADDALLEYIDDLDVRDAFEHVDKCYA
jgi:hypothetical protein